MGLGLRYLNASILKFRRRVGVSGVDVQIEASTNMQNWAPGGDLMFLSGQVVVEPGVVEESYDVTIAAQRMFFRVKVTQK
ncbi:hypothetical protein N9889_02220 [bacterium]|nr:hypothetical protein [bacterium]